MTEQHIPQFSEPHPSLPLVNEAKVLQYPVQSPSYAPEVTRRFNTAELYERFELEASKIMVTVPDGHGSFTEQSLKDDPRFRSHVHDALVLHSNETRMDGLYNDHILRNLIIAMADCGITDRDRLIGIALHDSIENQPKSLIKRFTGKEAVSTDPHEIRLEARSALAQGVSRKIAGYVWNLSTPIIKEGVNKIKAHTGHFNKVRAEQPDEGPHKTPDVTDNAVHNHLTPVVRKRLRSDLKYRDSFDAHIKAVLHPESPIPESHRDHVVQLLEWGKQQNRQRIKEADPKMLRQELLRLYGETTLNKAGIKLMTLGHSIRHSKLVQKIRPLKRTDTPSV